MNIHFQGVYTSYSCMVQEGRLHFSLVDCLREGVQNPLHASRKQQPHPQGVNEQVSIQMI